MSTPEKPESEEAKPERERKDWLVVLLILLLGFLCVIVAGQRALLFSPTWTLPAGMESNLDPNSDFLTKPGGFVEPVDAAILTQPAWVQVFLTPGASFVTGTAPPAGSGSIVPTQGTTAVPTNTIPVFTDTAVPTNTFIWLPPPPATNTRRPPPADTPTNTPLPTIDLEISMSDGGVIYPPGGNLIYTIVVNNNSAYDVTGATVTDSFGAQITGASWTCTPSVPTATCTNGAGNPFTDTINLPAGSFVTYTVTANVSPYSAGPLSNTATVSILPFETDPGDNTVTISTAGPGGGPGGDINIGPRDGSVDTLGPPFPTSLTMVIPPIVADGNGDYDLVYYEMQAAGAPTFPATNPRVDLDWVQIEISADGVSWQTVFYWGDPGGSSDDNTNVALPVTGPPGPVGTFCATEVDNCQIPFARLYNNTGIAIDIDAIVPPGNYSWIRITSPAGPDGPDVDAIEIL
ncbi:MAG: DUF11 domain-containing protein [Anaerolineales bacterium]|nr:DUF11 domain-containing protein [Anaerolineales bacterium]